MPLNRIAVLLALLALSSPLLAQQTGTDMYVSLEEFETPIAQNRTTYIGVRFGWLGQELVKQNALEIDVPGEVLNVFTGGDQRIECNTESRPIRCNVALESFAFSGAISIETKLTTPGTATVRATITSATTENEPSNNTATRTMEIVGLPDLHVSSGVSAIRIEPGQAMDFDTFVYDFGATATNVRITVTLGGGATFTSVQPENPATTCTLGATEIVCTHPRLDYPQQVIVRTKLVAPDRLDGGHITFSATAQAPEGEFRSDDNSDTITGTMVRHLLVTNTNDEGGGSLRQALLDAQQFCEDDWCTVDFRIPGTPPQRRFVIQPKSALPEVQGYVRVDGATQKTFGGDTNPDGPEIEINGALAGNAHGLLLGEGCEIWVTDLAITGFAWPGIEARRGPFQFDGGCNTWSGGFTIIARNVLRENYRGLVVTNTNYMTITDNVIENNRRAGLFIARGYSAEIHRNRVNGNGASGIFLDLGTRDYFAGGGHIEENEIANNGESAIARTPNGYLTIRKNSMHGNRWLGIDRGLDLVTPNRPNDGFPDAPNAPVLFSAQYDPVSNKTIVRGHIKTTQIGIGQSVEIDVYASDSLSRSGLAEGERWLSTTRVSSSTIDEDFTIELEGDLRGQYITATNTRVRFIGFVRPPDVGSDSHIYDSPGDTSELSNAVEVF